MTSLVPTTELSAVNDMLNAIGTAKVNTLVANGLTDAVIAQDTLHAVSREVQTRGWWFNKVFRQPLTPDVDNRIILGDNILMVSPSRATGQDSAEPRRFTLLGNYLTDLVTLQDNTFTTTVYADMIVLMQFESLPESVRRYITTRAARIFQAKALGDDTAGTYTETHEAEAWLILEEDQSRIEPSGLWSARSRARQSALRQDPITPATAPATNAATYRGSRQ